MDNDTLESLGRDCLKLGWRLDALDRWRGQVDKRVAVLESEIITEREARKMREILDGRARRDNAIRFTRWQVLAGLMVGAVSVADFVVRLLTLTGGSH